MRTAAEGGHLFDADSGTGRLLQPSRHARAVPGALLRDAAAQVAHTEGLARSQCAAAIEGRRKARETVAAFEHIIQRQITQGRRPLLRVRKCAIHAANGAHQRSHRHRRAGRWLSSLSGRRVCNAAHS